MEPLLVGRRLVSLLLPAGGRRPLAARAKGGPGAARSCFRGGDHDDTSSGVEATVEAGESVKRSRIELGVSRSGGFAKAESIGF